MFRDVYELTAKHDLLLDLYMVRLFFGLWCGGLVITSRAAESIGNRTYECLAWI